MSRTRKAVELFAGVNRCLRKGLGRVHVLCRDQQGLLRTQSYSDFLGKNCNTPAHHPLYPVLILQGSEAFTNGYTEAKEPNMLFKESRNTVVPELEINLRGLLLGVL